jgi:cyclophilin family peptidyl-prolyl cis-trans isomerase
MKKTAIILMATLALTLGLGCEKKQNQESQQNSDNNNITKETMQLSPESGDKVATIKTNLGDIKILLYTEQAPETTKNFIELSEDKKYDGVIFHRVIDDFMVQTGDFQNMNGTGGHSYKGPGTYLQDEFGKGLTHVYGAVSMANAGPNTGGSQFFIVQKEDGTDWLNGKHAIFGYAYEGMDVVEEIAKVEKDGMDRPLEDVKIETIIIEDYK